MPRTQRKAYLPDLERLEAKQPLGGGLVSVHGSGVPGAVVSKSNPKVSAEAVQHKPDYGYLVYRITNPNPYNGKLVPPFGHVLVQTAQPVPGQTYNILQIAVRNGTARTFTASSNFQVRFPGDPTTFPILTGNQTWAPGQDFMFYVLTKKYYPLPSQAHSGFDFSLDGARSVGIPGPSGIFLRVKYNPATINKVLDYVVQFGPGAQGGKGIKFGLPDTAIYEFVSSRTNRNDFSGYF